MTFLSAHLTRTPTVEGRHVSSGASTARQIGLSRRFLRMMLGCIWLLDGALQLQSFMFTKGFAHGIIAPSASGQPFFVAGPVEWNARLIVAHPVPLNGLFASIQLLLGLGLLFRRSARLAIVSSVVWAGGVWYLGEGIGGLAGGHMTALLGAPGAAVLYMVLALAAWPGPRDPSSHQDRVRRLRPPQWILRVWAMLWVGFAVLNVLPPNISFRTISSELTMNASMVPSWLAVIDRGSSSAVHTLGFGAVVITVALELAIGLLVVKGGALRTAALWAGIVVAALYWGVGQSFGQLFSGQATDPSTGPLLVIVGLTALGATRQSARPDVRAITDVGRVRGTVQTAA